jgi:hypothetical protein
VFLQTETLKHGEEGCCLSLLNDSSSNALVTNHIVLNIRMTVIDKMGRCDHTKRSSATFVVSTPDFIFVNRETSTGPAVGKILYRQPNAASPGCARVPTEA